MQPTVFGDQRVSWRIWNKMREDDNGCWLYIGRHTPSGWPAHNNRALWRSLYLKLVGLVPDNPVMLCGSDPRFCSNPYHRQGSKDGTTAPHVCATCGRLHVPD